ncbi:MAG TPA: cytochrome c-type biogenesis protein CcmH [Methylomirabilota bacterium]|nr:cytochrome c-type biogenesis protein CcmH [Methylomirabilota bacterium]
MSRPPARGPGIRGRCPPAAWARWGLAVALGLGALGGGLAAGPAPVAAGAAPSGGDAAARVTDEQVTAVASRLRCVVCQNLSVADSPSEMARQMRDLIRERLAAGESAGQVTDYFVQRYGEWVLLSPPARGLNLVLWIAPAAAVLAGLAVVARLTRGRRAPASAGAPAPAIGPVERARIAAELERLRE